MCKCGAKNCRGVIGGKGKDYLITIDNNKKALVSNSPVSIASQLTADAKFYSTKIPPAELTQIKTTAPKFAQLDHRQIKCTVCNCVLNYKVTIFTIHVFLLSFHFFPFFYLPLYLDPG